MSEARIRLDDLNNRSSPSISIIFVRLGYVGPSLNPKSKQGGNHSSDSTTEYTRYAQMATVTHTTPPVDTADIKPRGENLHGMS